MSRFRNTKTGVVVSVADEKDYRFNSSDWGPADKASRKPRSAKPDSDK